LLSGSLSPLRSLKAATVYLYENPAMEREMRKIIPKRSHLFILFSITLTFCYFCYQPQSFAVKRKKVSENGIVGTFYYSDSIHQQPPVLLFGGSSGGNFYDKYQNYPEDLVESGYAVLSLAYFDYQSSGLIPDKLRHIPLEYFKKAMEWLEEQPETSKGEISVIGNSRGGEAALLLATIYEEISTVIAIVPSAYVGGAYDNKRAVTGAAWTLNGKEVPYVDFQRAVANYDPWWKIIEDVKEVQPYSIPVEKMSAAVLLLSGQKDSTWPSTEMSIRIMHRLKRYNYPFPFEHISYNAGHDIRMMSWPDVMRFIKTHFPPP